MINYNKKIFSINSKTIGTLIYEWKSTFLGDCEFYFSSWIIDFKWICIVYGDEWVFICYSSKDGRKVESFVLVLSVFWKQLGPHFENYSKRHYLGWKNSVCTFVVFMLWFFERVKCKVQLALSDSSRIVFFFFFHVKNITDSIIILYMKKYKWIWDLNNYIIDTWET